MPNLTSAQHRQRAEAEVVVSDLLKVVPADQWAHILADAMFAHADASVVEVVGERISRAAHMKGR